MRTSRKHNIRVKLFQLQQGKCHLCDEDMLLDEHDETRPTPARSATLDHITPLNQNGRRSAVENFKLACFECNVLRRSLPIPYIRAQLQRRKNLVRQLFIDLDGVLGDFDKHYLETIGPLPERWRTEQFSEERQDVDWSRVDATNFFETMPLMPDALELWEYVKPHNPIILTGCPKHNPEGAGQNKRNMVARTLGPGVTVQTCLSKDKAYYCNPGDILVDDWIKYRHKWIQKGGLWITHTSARETIEQLILLGIT